VTTPQGLRRERRVSVGPVDVTVAMPVEVADRVRSHPMYRRVLKPTVINLRRLGQLHNGNHGANGHVPAEHAYEPLPPVPVEAPKPDDLDFEGRAIIEKIVGQEWYHSIDLGHGVVTPGFVDHREQLPYYGLPSSLAGKRILDLATFDGFWAFEFDRRGAEVVAADIPMWTDVDVPAILLPHAHIIGLDRPTGAGFRLADEILQSRVERVERSVYELTPETVGMFDLVFISDLLVHLRDPQLALDRARSVCRGEVIVADVYTPKLEGFGDRALAWYTAPNETWWLPNIATLKKMLSAAGFESIAEISRFTLQARTDDTIHKVVLRGEAVSRSKSSPSSTNHIVRSSPALTSGGTPDSLLRKQWSVHARHVDVKVSMPIDVADRLESNVAYRRLAKARPASHVHRPEPVKRQHLAPEPIGVEARNIWTKICDVEWLQSIDLGNGVLTPGLLDLRVQVPFYGLPDSLSGRRVVDFGTFDGFWAFELERRRADVTAFDLVDDDVRESMRLMRGSTTPDSVTTSGLVLAKEILRSRITVTEASAYCADAQHLGKFDLVLVSDVLRHLRCPQRALENAVALCDGEILVADVIAPELEGIGDVAIAEYKASGAAWWLPNAKTLANMMIVAGCEPVEEVARFELDAGQGGPRLQKVVLRGRVNTNPVWLQEWCRTAALTPPKWRSAEERQQ
jgi:tRNA (mo5U34)-methyltransferase